MNRAEAVAYLREEMKRVHGTHAAYARKNRCSTQYIATAFHVGKTIPVGILMDFGMAMVRGYRKVDGGPLLTQEQAAQEIYKIVLDAGESMRSYAAKHALDNIEPAINCRSRISKRMQAHFGYQAATEYHLKGIDK
jgi:hypothetical protein